MELETVGRVAVGNLGLQVGRQVDDMDSAERTFLGTDTAANAKAFGNEGDLGFGAHFDTELSGTDDGAGLLALLATFLQNEYHCHVFQQLRLSNRTFGLH